MTILIIILAVFALCTTIERSAGVGCLRGEFEASDGAMESYERMRELYKNDAVFFDVYGTPKNYERNWYDG